MGTAVVGGGEGTEAFLARCVEEVETVRGAVDGQLFELVIVSMTYRRYQDREGNTDFKIDTYRCSGTLVVELVIAISYEHCRPAHRQYHSPSLAMRWRDRSYVLIFQNLKGRSLRSLMLVATHLMP